jgi:hypothetical protein
MRREPPNRGSLYVIILVEEYGGGRMIWYWVGVNVFITVFCIIDALGTRARIQAMRKRRR